MTDRPPRDESKLVIPFPSSDGAEARLRARQLREMPPLPPEWHKRIREQWRFLLALRKLGILIGMYVLLRQNARSEAAAESVADAFRQAGFIVLWSGEGGFTLVAEPCLALSFMFKAAAAGVLSDELEDSLGKIIDKDTPLRVEDFDEVLEPLEALMASIEIIVSPSLGKLN